MFVALSEIHSSAGKSKKVRQESMDFSKQFTAEGRSFLHFSLNKSKCPRAFSLEVEGT